MQLCLSFNRWCQEAGISLASTIFHRLINLPVVPRWECVLGRGFAENTTQQPLGPRARYSVGHKSRPQLKRFAGEPTALRFWPLGGVDNTLIQRCLCWWRRQYILPLNISTLMIGWGSIETKLTHRVFIVMNLLKILFLENTFWVKIFYFIGENS